ncbi:hypothetical protein XI25_20435 [Paenibacillus sp. DMB20]|nr:hypothetical protein XI25_20435 [Paenibacillus sp. DMB20]
MTPAIMQKVRQIHQKRHGRPQGNRRKSVLIATISAIMVLSSITVYASTYFIEIKNKEGEIILTTKDPWKTTVSEYSQRRRKEAKAELKKKLKPGQVAVFYIKDPKISAKADPLDYFYNTIQHKTYDDLAKEIREKGAPELLPPDYVPEGYAFDHGSIQMGFELVPNTPEYESLLNELKKKAEKSNEKQGVFYKLVDWSRATASVLEYRKGDNRITIVAFARPKGSAVQVLTTEAVKLKVKGKEMILSTTSEHSRRLSWLSESETVFYMITEDPKDPLSNDEFAKIAAGMIPD